MVTFAQILNWSSRGLTTAAEAMRKAAQAYCEVHDDLERLLTEKVLGQMATAEARTRRALIDDADDLYRAHDRASHELWDAAEAVDAVVAEASRIRDRVLGAGLLLDENGRVIPNPDFDDSDGHWPLTINPQVTSWESGQCVTAAEAIIEDLKATYGALEAIGVAGHGQSFLITHHGVAAPLKTWTAEEVNDWWTALSGAEQQRIIAEHPEWIGNLAGIPSVMRHEANTRRLEGMIEEAQRKKAEWAERAKGALTPQERRNCALEFSKWAIREEDLRNVQTKFIDNPDGVHSLLSLDMNNGDRLWVSLGIGDVDKADHVFVHALGMNSTAGASVIGTELDKWGSGTAGVENVLESARSQLDNAPRDETVAAVVSLTYDAPTTLEAILYPPNSPVTNAPAAGYGEELTVMLEGIQATHSGDPHMVGSGHSLGALAISFAARNTEVLDDLNVFGAPRLRETSVDGHNVLPGHVSVAAADGDAISWINGIVGENPALNPEYVRYSTHEYVAPNGQVYQASHGHSQYMNEGYTSTYNMGSILIGDGVAVESGKE